MNDVSIRFERVSKRYRIGERRRYKTLREVWTDSFYEHIRRLSRFARRSSKNRDERGATREAWIWALRDVSFNIKQGEVIGIIGDNGAGKSTLLKIASRITKPTEGYAEIHGRVGSLLEVGTGFHPELTGRENIYLCGAILGMKRYEINRKFDNIIAFAETEKFLDTPVKHYSSGMFVRLAFAVAAHLEPEILIIDEVLAVGDILFQKKCLGKMNELSESQGRTVLFVSHNMGAIQRLCSKCMIFEEGKLIASGNTASTVAHYLSSKLSSNSCGVLPNQWIDVSTMSRTGTGKARFVKVQYSGLNETTGNQPYSGGPLDFLFDIVSDSNMSIGSIAATLYDLSGCKLVNADSISQGRVLILRKGLNRVRMRIKKLYLNPGIYRLGLWLANPIDANCGGSWFDFVHSAFHIEVVPQESGIPKLGMKPKNDGVVNCEIDILEAT